MIFSSTSRKYNRYVHKINVLLIYRLLILKLKLVKSRNVKIEFMIGFSIS